MIKRNPQNHVMIEQKNDLQYKEILFITADSDGIVKLWRLENNLRLSSSRVTNLSYVIYMCSSLLQLAVVSRDLSQAQKLITVCKAEQIHKMRVIFTQKENFLLPAQYGHSQFE